ncbi:hypothetical protein ACE1B6_19205 [Aerosakkonemataceae cyanobacterium BLCC-F154]|uniref:Uncharacterized protein n=1 Tax=Floridaenema fluviatile BLCC-F154 TaxID=3153640 RepID=A0ABV4YHP2_9CYAN
MMPVLQERFASELGLPIACSLGLGDLEKRSLPIKAFPKKFTE